MRKNSSMREMRLLCGVIASMLLAAGACGATKSTSIQATVPSTSNGATSSSTSSVTLSEPSTTTSIPSSTTTGVPSGTVACAGSGMSLTVGNADVGAGYLDYDFVLTNSMGAPCVVEGFPTVEFVASDSGPISVSVKEVEGAVSTIVPSVFQAVSSLAPTIVQPGGAASFYLQVDARPSSDCPSFRSQVSWTGSGAPVFYPSDPQDSMGSICPGSSETVSPIGPAPSSEFGK